MPGQIWNLLVFLWLSNSCIFCCAYTLSLSPTCGPTVCLSCVWPFSHPFWMSSCRASALHFSGSQSFFQCQLWCCAARTHTPSTLAQTLSFDFSLFALVVFPTACFDMSVLDCLCWHSAVFHFAMHLARNRCWIAHSHIATKSLKQPLITQLCQNGSCQLQN